MNHHSLMKTRGGKRVLCGAIVPANKAIAAAAVTCPNCVSRLQSKVHAELQAASNTKGQDQEFHYANAHTAMARLG